MVNGKLYEHIRYENFAKGQMPRAHKLKTDRVGEKRTMNCGLEAEIIAYRSSDDMDVQLGDKILSHVTYLRFRRGLLKRESPKAMKKQRLGEKRVMNCGHKAEIIDYRGCQDITVRFDTGETLTASYQSFQNGSLTPASEKSMLLKPTVMRNGLEAEFAAKDRTRGDVIFEDGAVRHDMTASSFYEKSVRYPKECGTMAAVRTRPEFIVGKKPKERSVFFCWKCSVCGEKIIGTRAMAKAHSEKHKKQAD